MLALTQMPGNTPDVHKHTHTLTGLKCCLVKLSAPTATAAGARDKEAARARTEEEVRRDGAAPPRGGEEARGEGTGRRAPDPQL